MRSRQEADRDNIIDGRAHGNEMKTTAYLVFALLGVIWGSNFIFVKWAAEHVSPGQIVLLRVVFGFLPIFCSRW